MERLVRWRATFLAWTTLLALLALVTVFINRELLVVVKRVAGERGGVVLAAIALLVVVPLAIDAFRNVRRTHGDRRRGGLERYGGDVTWTVPVPTPRRFREAQGPELTRRERSVVTQGQLAMGVVVHHGDLTSVRYAAPWGAVVTSRPVQLGGARPREGAEAELLFEPGARVGVAPSLHGLLFDAATIRDERPGAVIPTPARPQSVTAPLHATLHPVERFAHTGETEVGEIAVDSERLVARLGDATFEMQFDQPFALRLTCQPLPDRVEVCVAITPSDGGAYRGVERAAWCVKTELPQSSVATTVEVAWRDASYLAPHDFRLLWATLLAYAEQPELATSLAG